MSQEVIIDGNNLLFALHSLGPTRPLGREKMTREIERWAGQNQRNVVLVFDGPSPRNSFAKQFQSDRIAVIFSAPRAADDLIEERLRSCPNPERILVITDDSAIQHEARRRRCGFAGTVAFIAALFPPGSRAVPQPPLTQEEKPPDASTERARWLEVFDDKKSDDSFDGFEAMEH